MCEQEQRVERVRMALAEAGYPDARVYWDDEVIVVRFKPFLTDGTFGEWDIPADVVWRAFRVCGETAMCFECWNDDDRFGTSHVLRVLERRRPLRHHLPPLRYCDTTMTPSNLIAFGERA